MPDPRKLEGGLVQSIPPLPGVAEAKISLEEQMRAFREFFGFPEDPSVGEMALGFGVGSIGRVPPRILGSTAKTPKVQIEGQEITQKSTAPGMIEQIKKLRGSPQENFRFKFPEGGVLVPTSESVRNVGGVRPPAAFLESQAIKAQTAKQIQTKVKEVQKDLDALAIAEVNPLVPQSLIQQIAKKGLRAKTSHDPINDQIVISFKSKTAKVDVNDEFAILSTPDGPVLAVNFNSPTIKAELRPEFKRAFPNKFLGDEIGQEFQPGELQRMAGETAKDAPPPDNFSYFNLESFEDGLQVINRMLDIANAK